MAAGAGVQRRPECPESGWEWGCQVTSRWASVLGLGKLLPPCWTGGSTSTPSQDLVHITVAGSEVFCSSLSEHRKEIKMTAVPWS